MERLDYAIVFVSDMSKAVAFYRDVLGLPLKYETPHWTEFSNDGSTIALHPADKPNREGASPSPTQTGADVGAGLAPARNLADKPSREGASPSPTQTGADIGAGLVPARNPAGTAQLGFHVDNLDDWHKKLTAAGVRCLMEPRTEAYGIRQAVYCDADGLRFTLAEAIKK